MKRKWSLRVLSLALVVAMVLGQGSIATAAEVLTNDSEVVIEEGIAEEVSEEVSEEAEESAEA